MTKVKASGKVILVTVLCISMILLGGCSFTEYDEEADMAQVVATVGDVDITKGEVMEYVDYDLAMETYYYGYEEGSTEYEARKQELIELRLEQMINIEMAWQDFQADGGELTEDEQTQVQDLFDENIVTIEDQATTELETELGEDAKITQEQLDTKVDELLLEQGYTRDQVMELISRDVIYSAYYEEITNDIEATDEQISTYYDDKLKEQKETYANDMATLDSDYNSGEPILYYPQRVVMASQILIGISEDDTAEINEVKNSTELSEDEIATQTETLLNAALKKIKSKADTVLGKAEDGEDFNALITKYNDDTGMESMLNLGGYLVYEGQDSFVPAFESAALALKKEGDISGLVSTDYGYHIIRAEKIYEAGYEVPLKDAKTLIEPAATDNIKQEVWDAAISSLKEKYNVQTFMDRF